ncbi:hypothetical protein [Streptomyces sp. NPDC056632]|uniref:hypothetical protein n=1 Tax=Streptomyces sp. NPDC056632 TaxID=3345884 RepID=UPI00367662C9
MRRVADAEGGRPAGVPGADRPAGVAEGLGSPPAAFPSGHGGFLGGEFGRHGAPEAFAKALRAALEA